MKTPLTLLAALSLGLLAPSCTTLPDGTRQPNTALIQSGAFLLTQGALAAATPAQRARIVPYLSPAAAAIRSLSGGAAPTPGMIADALKPWTQIPDPLLVSVISGAAGLYSQYWPAIRGDPKLALQVLEAIARGVESAAGSVTTGGVTSLPRHTSPSASVACLTPPPPLWLPAPEPVNDEDIPLPTPERALS